MTVRRSLGTLVSLTVMVVRLMLTMMLAGYAVRVTVVVTLVVSRLSL